MQLDAGDCITHVAIDGLDHVVRLQFETRNGRAYVVGGSDQVLDRWDTVNDDGNCLTGVYGVYNIIDELDVRLLSSIGFYFDG